MEKPILSSILKLIFPDKCIFCSAILENSSGINICDRCNRRAPYIGNREAVMNRLLYKDLTDKRHFDKIVCVFSYEGVVRKAIIKYKYNGKGAYYRTFARLIGAKLLTSDESVSYDGIMAVPLHGRRERNRGYNQSELISSEVGRLLGIKDMSGGIKRIKSTQVQSTVGAAGRYENIKGAFKVVNPDLVRGKNILVVDDVLTTGNTLNECCRALKECGCAKTDGAVVAASFRLKL